MAFSKPVGYQRQTDERPFMNDDGEPELISKVYDEISNCLKQDQHQELSEPFLEATDEEEDEHASETVSCAKCVKHIRIERVSQIRKGLHIAMPGKRFHKYDASERKQTWAYMHHAIVADVRAMDDKRYIIEVALIHMWKQENGKLGLSKTCETFDLKKDELYLVFYNYPRYNPNEIVKRAEQAFRETETARVESKRIRFRDYNVVTTNCEHFATWCVVGKNRQHKETSWWEALGQKIIELGDSAQVMKMKSVIVQLFGGGSMVKKTLFKLIFESSDEIAKVVKSGLPGPTTVLTGAAAFYLLYCLVMAMYYHMLYSRKEICRSCYKGNIVDLWAQCSVYGLTSVATYFVMGGSVCISSVLSALLIIVLSVAAQHYIPNIRKALMAPYGCEKKAIYRLDDLNVGDIVTLSYWCLPHDVIITEIHAGKRRRKGKIRAVHYALDRLLSTREVREEYFDVKRRGHLSPIMKRHECGHLDLFPPETAVIRARQRVGERKWHATTNRSDHVCYWAKVKPQLAEEDRDQGLSDSIKGKGISPHLSTLLIGECDVHLSSEIEVGDALKVRGSEGIVVAKECSERKMKLQVVTVRKAVKQLNYFIDLNKENVSVIKYHPAHCYPKNVRAARARLAKGGEGGITIKKFMDFCILQDK